MRKSDKVWIVTFENNGFAYFFTKKLAVQLAKTLSLDNKKARLSCVNIENLEESLPAASLETRHVKKVG